MSTDLAHPLWLGPQTYEEKDAARFHGRAAETAELLDLIRREPLVLLHGESGHGKSSLLQAGLAPRLREQGALPIILRDLFRKDVPDITAALLAAIVAQAAARDCTAPEPRPGDTLWEYFHRANSWFTGPDGQSLVPVLILDQFEDLFRRCDWRPGDTATPAALFLAQFADLLENREPAAVRERRLRREGDEFDHAPTALRVLIGLREDALPDLTPLRASIPGLARTPYRLRPLTRASAKEVILRPVADSPAHAGLLGENPNVLAEDILTRMAPATAAADAAAVQSVDPFLLSVVMDQLQRRADAAQPAVITHALVKDGVAAALDTFYETAVALVPVALRDWLETDAGLVTAGGFRNSVAADDAEHALRDSQTSAHLRTLENAHLLRAEPRPDGSLRFELVHDRLCTVLAGKIRLRAEARAEQERIRLEAQAEEERRRAAMLDAARKRALIVAALAVAAGIVAVVFYFQARAQVKEASRSDFATGQQRLEQGKWQEALAYIGRAIRYDAENLNAQDALWLALRHGRRDAGQFPVFKLVDVGRVRSASLSPDGSMFMSIVDDSGSGSYFSHRSHIRLWSAPTGNPIGERLNHGARLGSMLWSASFSPDSTRVITARGDNFLISGEARIWNALTGLPIGNPLIHNGSVKSAVFSPDGTRVVTASEDKTARIWDANTGLPIGDPLIHNGSVKSAVFSPDGTRAVTASEDKSARIWDANTGLPIGNPLIHNGSVKSAVFSPDGTRVVTASEDKSARLWDANTGLPIGDPLIHNGSVKSAVFSPDGTRVATASEDKTARIWDANTGLPIGNPLIHDASVNSANFSPDGTRVVTAISDGSPCIWDVKNPLSAGAPLEQEGVILTAEFTSDGGSVATEPTRAPYGGSFRLWDATTGKPVGKESKTRVRERDFSLSSDRSRIIKIPFEDSRAAIEDMVTHMQIGPPLKHEDYIEDAAFSPDGNRIVTAGIDRTARIWDARTPNRVTSSLAELLTGTIGGAMLDPQLGTLKQLTAAERLALREKLAPYLSTAPDWRFVVEQMDPQDPKTALVSPRMTMKVREATNRLISTMVPGNIREALGADPASPLLPFAHATIEAVANDNQPANPIRAAWLVDYGMKRLPADLTADELRIAARLIAKVAETLPEQKKHAITLLDRALSLAPEDDETRQLRESLK